MGPHILTKIRVRQRNRRLTLYHIFIYNKSKFPLECLLEVLCFSHISLLINYIRQRSWANVMYSPLFVCLSVCLSVCLLAGLLKKLWTDLNEI